MGTMVFERNKIPEDKGSWHSYLLRPHHSGELRILSDHKVSYNVRRWIKKVEERLPISTERKPRNLIAIDETVVRANGKRYFVYAAIDVERKVN